MEGWAVLALQGPRRALLEEACPLRLGKRVFEYKGKWFNHCEVRAPGLRMAPRG